MFYIRDHDGSIIDDKYEYDTFNELFEAASKIVGKPMLIEYENYKVYIKCGTNNARRYLLSDCLERGCANGIHIGGYSDPKN